MPTPPAAPNHQNAVGRLARAAFVQQGPSHLIVRQTDRIFETDGFGKNVHGLGRRHDIFGIAAAPLREIARAQQHLLADRDPLNPVPDSRNPAGDVVAGIGGQWRHPFVDAAPDQDVGLADAKGLGADLDIMRARLRNFPVHIVERFGAPGPMHQHSFHRGRSCLRFPALPRTIFENSSYYENYCNNAVAVYGVGSSNPP